MVRYTMGGVLKRFGVATVFSAAAHYCLHLLEPLAASYLHPTAGQRLTPPAIVEIVPPVPREKPLEELLAEAVYVPK